MNKEELINIKQMLGTKVCVKDDGLEDYTMADVYKGLIVENGTAKAVKHIEKYFEKVMENFAKKNIDYSEIVLFGHFGLMAKEEDLVFNGGKCHLKGNYNPLFNIARFRIQGFCCENDTEIVHDDPEKISYPEEFDDYFVNVKEFIKLIEQKGFSFEGVKDFEEMKEILADSNRRCPAFIKLKLSRGLTTENTHKVHKKEIYL